MIGTLTFHWAVNYGAVLQAYALQKYLIESGYNTEIINYVPFRQRIIKALYNVIHFDFQYFLKKYRLETFIKNEMVISNQKYRNNKALFKCKDRYELIITGSDQVWNQSFTCGAEKKPTLSYFINFASPKTKRIAYAVSFGTDEVSKRFYELVTPEIRKFYKISVRENSGKEILGRINEEASLVCDPTFLLSKSHYSILSEKSKNSGKKVFIYLLHNNQCNAYKIKETVCDYFSESERENENNIDLYTWLSMIRYSEFVVTNSFHGVALSLIFNTPFVAIPVENSKMNGRIQTLLENVELSDRICYTTDETAVMELCKKKIDWERVNFMVSKQREIGSIFIQDCINSLEIK